MADPKKKAPSADGAEVSRSLVPAIDWASLGTRAPIDWRLFGIAFSGAVTLFAVLAFYAPAFFIKSSEKHAALTLAEAEKTPAQQVEAQKPPETLKPEDFSERQKQAIATNDKVLNDSLGPAPIEALEERYRQGFLPRVSEDGRKPWYLYSRPFDKTDPRPRIAVALANLGYSRALTDAALTNLPGAVTMVFSAAGTAAEAWMARARSNGHETILSIPMEPLDYPASDPGPDSVLVKNTIEENIERLRLALLRGKGYAGVTTLSGSRITSTPDELKPLLDEFYARGLLFMDATLTPMSSAYALAKESGLPSVKTNFTLTPDMGAVEAAGLLSEVENVAMRDKRVTLLVHATPLTLRQLAEWLPGLNQKGLALAPISAMTE